MGYDWEEAKAYGFVADSVRSFTREEAKVLECSGLGYECVVYVNATYQFINDAHVSYSNMSSGSFPHFTKLVDDPPPNLSERQRQAITELAKEYNTTPGWIHYAGGC